MSASTPITQPAVVPAVLAEFAALFEEHSHCGVTLSAQECSAFAEGLRDCSVWTRAAAVQLSVLAVATGTPVVPFPLVKEPEPQPERAAATVLPFPPKGWLGKRFYSRGHGPHGPTEGGAS